MHPKLFEVPCPSSTKKSIQSEEVPTTSNLEHFEGTCMLRPFLCTFCQELFGNQRDICVCGAPGEMGPVRRRLETHAGNEMLTLSNKSETVCASEADEDFQGEKGKMF